MQISSSSLLFDGILRGRALRTFQVLGLALLGTIVPVAFWLGIDLAGSPHIGPLTLAGLSICLLFLLLAGLILELFFQIVRIPGALLLRIEQIWNFASPAICIFLITAEPLIRWSGLVSTGPVLPQLAGHSILLALGLIVLLGLLFVFPLFRGMNATFLLTGVLAARFLLIPATIGPESDFREYATFTLYSFALSLLIFLFLQSRRRLALSPGYETFPVPYGLSYVAFFSIPLMLALYFATSSWYPNFPGHIPALMTIFLAVHWWVSGLVLSRDSEGKTISPVISLLLSLCLVAQIGLLVHSFSAGNVSRASLKSTVTAESLTFFAAFLDQDRDGNSSFPGQDPDDSNPNIRADFIASEETVRNKEGSEENSEAGRGEPKSADPAGQRLLTLVLDQEAFSGASSPVSPLAVLTSDEIPYAVRDLLHGRDPVANVESRSILSDYVDRGFRTICTGNGEYFSHVHPARLDQGCQVLEPATLSFGSDDVLPLSEHETTASENSRSDGSQSSDIQLALNFLSKSGTLFRKYREDRFFLWLHLDMRGSSIAWKDLQPVLDTWKEDFEGKRNTLILLDGPAGLVFIDSGLFPVARSRSRIGFYRSRVPAPWSQAMHELYGASFKFPMQSFGMDDGLWVGNQMTGSKMQYPLPWKTDAPVEAEKKRQIKNLQP